MTAQQYLHPEDISFFDIDGWRAEIARLEAEDYPLRDQHLQFARDQVTFLEETAPSENAPQSADSA